MGARKSIAQFVPPLFGIPRASRHKGSGINAIVSTGARPQISLDAGGLRSRHRRGQETGAERRRQITEVMSLGISPRLTLATSILNLSIPPGEGPSISGAR